ncbi:MAG: magnesium transporter [Candidatus Woesearchaeota archaeon]
MEKDFKEILSSEIFSLTGGLAVGTLLLYISDKLWLLPGLFILWPGLLDLNGDLSGSVAARISSALHLGTLDLNKKYEKHVVGNLIASFVLSIIMGFILGFIAFLSTLLFFHKNSPQIIFVGGISALCGAILTIPVTITLSIMFYLRGNDPNNIMGPFMATIGDVAGAIGLIFTLMII